MAPETSFDTGAITTAADGIGSLLNGGTRRADFEALATPPGEAGSLPMAKWLGQAVSARRGAIGEHYRGLDAALGDMATKLRSIAADLHGADGANAAAMADFAALKSEVDGRLFPPGPSG